MIYVVDPLLYLETSEACSLSLEDLLKVASWEEEVSLASCTWIELFSCFSSPSRVGPSSQEWTCVRSSWAASHSWVWCLLEPGYYEDGAFGIRIENVVLVVPVKTKVGSYIFIYF